jgi:acetyl-CoA carboxylase biotin carboxyl carrier protein
MNLTRFRADPASGGPEIRDCLTSPFPFQRKASGRQNAPEQRYPLDLKEIKLIIDLMKKSDLTEFAVEEENFKLKIRRAGSTQQVVTTIPAMTAASNNPPSGPQLASPALTQISSASAADQDEPGITYIKSPMVGTFYTTASPENPAFIELNQQIEGSSVVCIIEAMKIMNEIQAETKGTILEILVESGQPVEYGQRLFKVRST